MSKRPGQSEPYPGMAVWAPPARRRRRRVDRLTVFLLLCLVAVVGACAVVLLDL